MDVATLVEALRDPACYPHPAARIEVRETHISYVLLAGDFAYKLKKPVRLPFLDFSSPVARRHYCQEEVRLNRRTAPALYLGVETIGGEPTHPRVGDTGNILEYAVKMRRFPEAALFSRMAQEARLTPTHVDALADSVARFHGAIAGAAPPAGLGTAEHVTALVAESLAELRDLGASAALARIEPWVAREQAALTARFNLRRHEGFVRECHGDLHLGNVAWVDGDALLFDGLEFAARLRWSDVMADVAFAFMDLARLGATAAAWRLLNRYLEATGDYAGVELLRYYAVYRALVRAKVAAIRARQARTGGAECERHLELAGSLARGAAPVLVLMHGVSGSGKTVVAQRLLESLGAVRIRSDVERKRLHGLAATARVASAVGEGLYAGDATERTHARLEQLAHGLLLAGYPVIVDATFLDAERRRRFAELARALGAGFQVVSCTAPAEVLRERVAARGVRGTDASDAGLAVLQAQLAGFTPLPAAERRHATFLDTRSAPAWQAAVEALAARFRTRE